MIDASTGPGGSVVADIALQAGLYMSGGLASGGNAIVAGSTGAHDLSVVYAGFRLPGNAAVAGFAHVAGKNMGR